MPKRKVSVTVQIPVDLAERMDKCQKLLGLKTKNEFRFYAFLLACEHAETHDRLRNDARAIRHEASGYPLR